VSFPLTWGQVKKGLDPQRYTLRTTPALLAKSEAWGGYDKAARPLKDAIEKLAKG
jgi:bifunctional non-homologous end joining protein LigD